MTSTQHLRNRVPQCGLALALSKSWQQCLVVMGRQASQPPAQQPVPHPSVHVPLVVPHSSGPQSPPGSPHSGRLASWSASSRSMQVPHWAKSSTLVFLGFRFSASYCSSVSRCSAGVKKPASASVAGRPTAGTQRAVSLGRLQCAGLLAPQVWLAAAAVGGVGGGGGERHCGSVHAC